MKFYLTIPLLFTILSFCGITPKSKKNTDILGFLLERNNSEVPVAPKVTIPSETADTVTYAPGDTGSEFGDKVKAINGVRGGGKSAGSLDVFSLASTGANASMILEWAGKRVINGEGIDFIVYENPFQTGSDSNIVFFEPIIVEVGIDKTNFCGFAPSYTNSNQTIYSKNPNHWNRFAGIKPVFYNIETNPLTDDDLFNVSKTGGDAFDLSDLSADNYFNTGCSSALRSKILSSGFVYLRLTSASDRINPNTNSAYLQDSASIGGPDIDGVLAKHRVSR
jgi:hypothetical protein